MDYCTTKEKIEHKKKNREKIVFQSLCSLKKEVEKASTTSLVQLTTEPPAEKANKFACLLWKWITKIISCCYSHKRNSFQRLLVCMNSQDRDPSSLYMP